MDEAGARIAAIPPIPVLRRATSDPLHHARLARAAAAAHGAAAAGMASVAAHSSSSILLFERQRWLTGMDQLRTELSRAQRSSAQQERRMQAELRSATNAMRAECERMLRDQTSELRQKHAQAVSSLRSELEQWQRELTEVQRTCSVREQELQALQQHRQELEELVSARGRACACVRHLLSCVCAHAQYACARPAGADNDASAAAKQQRLRGLPGRGRVHAVHAVHAVRAPSCIVTLAAHPHPPRTVWSCARRAARRSRTAPSAAAQRRGAHWPTWGPLRASHGTLLPQQAARVLCVARDWLRLPVPLVPEV